MGFELRGGQEQLLMRTIASQTGGRYYYPKHAQQLPSIFIKEAKTLKRSMIQNKTFTPAVSQAGAFRDVLPPPWRTRAPLPPKRRAV